MSTISQRNPKLFQRVWKDQRGITGLETAIVLIAFVVVASVFAYAVITTGLFSSEKAQTSAQSGVEAAKSTMVPKGSMILAEAQATGANTVADAGGLVMTLAGDDIVVEGVKVGDTINNETTGASCVLTTVVPLVATCTVALAGGTNTAWGATDLYAIDMNEVSVIRFKVTPSPGATPFSLDQANTVVSFNDSNNNLNGVYADPLLDASPFVADNVMEWTHTWLVGNGPAISTGDVVEFSVQVKGLTKPLSVNAPFSVEIVPQSGSALSISLKNPVEMALVMDLN